jgi:flagellin
MSLRINTNVAALNAYNNLSANQSKLESAFTQLSSGLRINRAADDASGLAISQNLTSQINGLTQAVSNTQDATNVAQIADGALGTSQDVLQRMRTLVVQASNSGTQDSKSLGAIQQELGSLSKQLDSIAAQTAFGGKKLLDGNYSGTFQVGWNGSSTDQVSLALNSATGKGFSAADLGVDAVSAGGSGSIDVTTGSPSSLLSTIDGALDKVSSARATIGATQNQLSYTATNLQTAITNVTASRSNLTDADLGTQVTKMTQQQVLTQAATSVLAQANSAPQAILKLLQ